MATTVPRKMSQLQNFSHNNGKEFTRYNSNTECNRNNNRMVVTILRTITAITDGNNKKQKTVTSVVLQQRQYY